VFPSADAGQRSAFARLSNTEHVTLLQTRNPFPDKQYFEYLLTCYSQVQRSEAGRACTQRAGCTSAGLHSRRVEDNTPSSLVPAMPFWDDTPYLDEVNASTGKTVEREYEQHRAKGGSGVSFALGPRHGPALAAGADQPFDG